MKNNDQTDLLEKVDKLTTSTDYDVPVKQGYVTRVYLDGVNIANAVSPMTIEIPKYSAGDNTKVSSVPTLVYTPSDEYPNTLENDARMFQVVCFEDSHQGDYDYNDLVIHVAYQVKGNRFAFGVQPIAMGASKSIELGCIVYKGTTQIYKGLITTNGNDCRKQYFKSMQGMINTQTANFFPENASRPGWHQYLGSTIKCWDMSKINSEGSMRVEWYIKVDGDVELYALSSKYLSQSFDKMNYPYGIVITNTGLQYLDGNKVCGSDWFNYPQEKVHIKDVYPELWSWLSTSNSYDFADIYSKEIRTGAFDATGQDLFIAQSIELTKDSYLVN